MKRISNTKSRKESKVFRMLIDGKWIESKTGKTYKVHNPASGDLIAEVPDADEMDANIAIEAASKAFPEWSGLPAKERAEFLINISDLIYERREMLARLISSEGGKPINEARLEIDYAAEFLTFFAEECKRTTGEVIPSHLKNKRFITIRQPIGVSAVITVWNYPLAGLTRPLAPALASGCTAVVKPAEQTPLSAIAFFELIEEAGLPKGVANLVTTLNPRRIGKEFLKNQLVRKISFTGSTETGKAIMRGASLQLKKVTLELGGHAPFIVFEDADIEASALAAAASKFQNTGQTCVALNRIYIHESVEKQFTTRFIDLVKMLKMGDPLDESVQIGPLIDKDGLLKVKSHMEDALSKGAKLLTGGKQRTDNKFAKGLFFEPTVLSQVTHDMLIMQEETFGPVTPIVPFKSEDEVLSYANELPYGLAAFFYTRDISRAIRISEGLEYGLIGINNSSLGAAQIPFGGVKQSGFGKEGGRLGLEEFLETKLISIGF
jgi:succinate-semialdehyde dehydrogenase / glutarate-semialdehyde dehydrogenase